MIYSTLTFDIGKLCAFVAQEIREIVYRATMVDTSIEHGI